MTCPWCEGRITPVMFYDKDAKGNQVRMLQFEHDCELGHVRYKAWERGW